MIYLDYAATTPVAPEVEEAMRPYWRERFGNPASIHVLGREARDALDQARDRVAACLGADSSEIIFTSGGTEADNLALVGVALAMRERGNHLVVSSVEHHAVLESCQFLQTLGFQITHLSVDQHGVVDPEQAARALTDRTVLLSVMLANNEVGTIQPVAELSRLARERGVYFHCDAVQALGALPVRADQLGADLISVSSHKVYGPKGVGALYLRRGTRLMPVLHGGAQEQNRRAGTENLPGIVGFARAVELADAVRPQEAERQRRLRDDLIGSLLDRVPDSRLNGHPAGRLPNNANFSFQGVDGESLLLNLDLRGICASSGAACAAGSIEPSHVLKAMGLSREQAGSSLRLTLGRPTTQQEIGQVVEAAAEVVGNLRASRAFPNRR